MGATILILMAETEVTVVTQPKERDILKLGNTLRRACLLNWLRLVNSEANYYFLGKREKYTVV